MERIDDLQNGYRIIQDTDTFCFGTDAVLLSDFATVKNGERVIDLCCGNGIIPLLLFAKYKPSHVTGIEIQEVSANLAKRTMQLNNLQDKTTIICDNLKNAKRFIEKPVDVVTCNPPYTEWGSGYVNDCDSKMIARHEIFCQLNDIFKSVSEILKFGGRFYMVHKSERLAEIISIAKSFKLEPKELQFLHGSVDKNSKLMLISFLNGGGSQMTVYPPIFDVKGTEI
ncbi:MAG: tRNA1(Val) (adenine(37)-N6)-methyltransferase [Monoglobales bacterium]